MFKIQTDQGFKSITHLQEFNLNRIPKEHKDYLKIQNQNLKTLQDLLGLCQES
jgi:hypothetical protein